MGMAMASSILPKNHFGKYLTSTILNNADKALCKNWFIHLKILTLYLRPVDLLFCLFG
jgi:hypothetical protein